jgi:hypothetical protein
MVDLRCVISDACSEYGEEWTFYYTICTNKVALHCELSEQKYYKCSSRKRRTERKADNLTSICEPIVQKMWEPRRLSTLWVPTACYRDSFTLPLSRRLKQFSLKAKNAGCFLTNLNHRQGLTSLREIPKWVQCMNKTVRTVGQQCIDFLSVNQYWASSLHFHLHHLHSALSTPLVMGKSSLLKLIRFYAWR